MSILVSWHCSLCYSTNTHWEEVEVFQRESDFLNHFDRTCHICQSEFTCKRVCSEHKWNRHTPTKQECMSKCSLCGAEFHSKQEFKAHQSEHQVYKCFCSSTLGDFEAYKSHVAQCSSYQSKAFWSQVRCTRSCFACQKKFDRTQELKEHFKGCDGAIWMDIRRVSRTRSNILAWIDAENDASVESILHKFPITKVPLKPTTIPIKKPLKEVTCSDDDDIIFVGQVGTTHRPIELSKAKVPVKDRRLLLPPLKKKVKKSNLDFDLQYLSKIVQMPKVVIEKAKLPKTTKVIAGGVPRLVLPVDSYRNPVNFELNVRVLDSTYVNVLKELGKIKKMRQKNIQLYDLQHFPADQEVYGFRENGLVVEAEQEYIRLGPNDISIECIDDLTEEEDDDDDIEVCGGVIGTTYFSTLLNLDGQPDEDVIKPEPDPLKVEVNRPEIKTESRDTGYLDLLATASTSLEATSKCSSPKPPAKCLPCSEAGDEDFVFTSEDSKLIHDLFYHDLAYCPDCKLSFESRNELEDHDQVYHKQFVCEHCAKMGTAESGLLFFFDKLEELVAHSLDVHGVFQCVLCTYTLSLDGDHSVMTDHLERMHKVVSPSLSFLDVAKSDFRVVCDETRLTSDCTLCLKKVKKENVFSHIRFSHKVCNTRVIKMLVNVGFTTNPSKTALLPEVPSFKIKPRTKKISKSTKQNATVKSKLIVINFDERSRYMTLPRGRYICPIETCDDPYRKADLGLHLVLDHRLCFCLDCGAFFVSRDLLVSHLQRSHDKQSVICPECHDNVAGPFKRFALHCLEVHDVFVCPLCQDGALYRNLETYLGHLTNYHAIHHKVFGDRSPRTLLDKVLRMTVAVFADNVLMCVLCNDFSVDGNEAEQFAAHLLKHHELRNVERFMASFDPRLNHFNVNYLQELYNDSFSDHQSPPHRESGHRRQDEPGRGPRALDRQGLGTQLQTEPRKRRNTEKTSQKTEA